ncbi:MAG: hypothetical protein ACR2RE_18665 [Geminicoccaceae bacterium]
MKGERCLWDYDNFDPTVSLATWDHWQPIFDCDVSVTAVDESTRLFGNMAGLLRSSWSYVGVLVGLWPVRTSLLIIKAKGVEIMDGVSGIGGCQMMQPPETSGSGGSGSMGGESHGGSCGCGGMRGAGSENAQIMQILQQIMALLSQIIGSETDSVGDANGGAASPTA